MPSDSPSLTIRVRRSTTAHLDSLIAVFRGSVRIVARRDYTHEQMMAWAPDEIDREQWTTRLADNSTWVAEIGEAEVGFVNMELGGHIHALYVHPDHQGRGVGSALLAEAESAAREQGSGRLYTEASITARPFFQRHGFRVIAPQTVALRGQEFVNYRMEKQLT